MDTSPTSIVLYVVIGMLLALLLYMPVMAVFVDKHGGGGGEGGVDTFAGGSKRKRKKMRSRMRKLMRLLT